MIYSFRNIFLIFCIFLVSCNGEHCKNQETLVCEENKKVLSIIYKVFESGDISTLDRYIHEEMYDHTLDPLIINNGIRGLKELIHVNLTAFPDLKVKVYNISAEGDLVYSHFNFSGTNSGPIRNSPPSMKTIDIDGVDILRFKDGKIIEHWGYWDTLKFLNQLGEESN